MLIEIVLIKNDTALRNDLYWESNRRISKNFEISSTYKAHYGQLTSVDGP